MDRSESRRCQRTRTTSCWPSPRDGERSRILFSNPASEDARTNGTVRLSYDEGQTWPVAKTIPDGRDARFAYSCLTVLPDRTVGCLFENKDEYQQKQISLAQFSLDWLTDGNDPG